MKVENVVKQPKINGKKIGGITGKGFKKGKSGNPNGRPKKEICIPDMFREILDAPDPFDPEKKRTALQAICRRVVNLGIGGNLDAVKIIFDRTEGKALVRVLKQKTDDILEVK